MASEHSLPLILIADDHTDDLFFIRRRLDRIGVKNPVVTFSDGDRLTSFLRAMCVRGTREKSLKPAALFLDLDLPGGAAFETLLWVRGNPAMRDLQVVILSDAASGPRLRRAVDLGFGFFLPRRPTIEAVEKIAHAIRLLDGRSATRSVDKG